MARVTQAEIARQVRGARSHFYLAMRLMPPRKRAAMFAIYAFARVLDDVVDGPAPPDEKRRALEKWRTELARAYDGRPATAIGQALAAAVATYSLPRAEFEALIQGMEMDVGTEMRAPALATLDLYCRRVAGTIGLLSLPVFGCDAAPERDFATKLARALQLTNIARDLAEDSARGRLYVPREILNEVSIADTDPARVATHPRFATMRQRLCDLAQDAFAAADAALARCTRPRRLWPALMMMGTYRRLLATVAAAAPAASRARVGRRAQMWIALRVLVLARP
jgi:squalene synthase HpnD